jgi:hypothetical protein
LTAGIGRKKPRLNTKLFFGALHPDTLNEGPYLALGGNFAFAVDTTGVYGDKPNNLLLGLSPDHKITV